VHVGGDDKTIVSRRGATRDHRLIHLFVLCLSLNGADEEHAKENEVLEKHHVSRTNEMEDKARLAIRKMCPIYLCTPMV
jgi:hypothetical protein